MLLVAEIVAVVDTASQSWDITNTVQHKEKKGGTLASVWKSGYKTGKKTVTGPDRNR